MKNIFLLPTENPSRLVINASNVLVLGKDAYTITEGKQFVYVTSDEKIKDGEYVYDVVKNKVRKSYMDLPNNNLTKKIILTTDPDLILDGIQEVDDEFLEWLVKNSTCGSIEVKQSWYGNSASLTGKYEVIYPKPDCDCSEPTGFYLGTTCGKCLRPFRSVPNQQTLDEFRKEYVAEINCELYSEQTNETIRAFCSDAIEETAKWCQQTTYTEQQLKDIALKAVLCMGGNWDASNVIEKFNECFEHVKKSI